MIQYQNLEVGCLRMNNESDIERAVRERVKKTEDDFYLQMS